VCAAIALTVLPAYSDAAAPAQRFFHTKGGAIECELDNGGGLGVNAYCQTQAPPRSVTLSNKGRVHVCAGDTCIGNGPENAATLASGHSIALGPFTCKATRSAIACKLADGKGFSISLVGVKTL
jgi:hypothetical protein